MMRKAAVIRLGVLGVAFVFVACAFPAVMYAQKVEISALGGWMWTSRVDADQGEIKVSDPGNFEGAIGIYVAKGTQVELSYTYSKVNAEFIPDLGSTVLAFNEDVSVNYFLASGLREFKLESKVVPYVLGSLGAVLYHPTAGAYDDAWRFAFGFGGGAKVNLSERLGIRLQARLLIPVNFEGVGFFFGTGGADIGVGGGINGIQGDFSGGLSLRLGPSKAGPQG